MELTKRLFFIIALFGVLLQSFSKLIVYSKFAVNKEYIVKNLCVKKDEPNNCCQGKCHLKKELEEDEKRESAPPTKSLKEDKEFQIICLYAKKLEIKKFDIFLKHNIIYCLIKATTPVFKIFHPPC